MLSIIYMSTEYKSQQFLLKVALVDGITAVVRFIKRIVQKNRFGQVTRKAHQLNSVEAVSALIPTRCSHQKHFLAPEPLTGIQRKRNLSQMKMDHFDDLPMINSATLKRDAHVPSEV